MYSPLVKAFNYALDKLSELVVPGLPPFQESRQIVFHRTDPEHIVSETYLQGSYKPDIVLLKWDCFKTNLEYPKVPYSQSHESDLCCKSGFTKPHLSWRNVLSTLEVRLGSHRASDDDRKESGNKPRARENFVKYTGDFGELGADRQTTEPSKSSRSPLLEMAPKVNSTRSSALMSLPILSFVLIKLSFIDPWLGRAESPECGCEPADSHIAKEA